MVQPFSQKAWISDQSSGRSLVFNLFCSLAGPRIQGQDLHRHSGVLHRQEDDGHDARQKGHLTQLRAVPKTQIHHLRS